MFHQTISRRADQRASEVLFRLVGLVVFVLAAMAASAADNPPQPIPKDMPKVERNSTDTGDNGSGSAPRRAGGGGSKSTSTRVDFEALLERKHAGTYSFYSKLPEKSRAEIYLDYTDGVTIDVLRKKIVDRYLNP